MGSHSEDVGGEVWSATPKARQRQDCERLARSRGPFIPLPLVDHADCGLIGFACFAQRSMVDG